VSRPLNELARPNVIIEPLDKAHDRAAFSCGDKALDNYLKTQARQDIAKKVAVTFVLVPEGTKTIVGYYSLSSTSIRLDRLPSELAKKLPKYPDIPSTLLGRLAVDLHYRGKGYGEFLLVDALKKSYEQSDKIGSAVILVDAKNEAAQDFYERYGFIALPDLTGRLFLPMKTVERLFRA